MKVYHCVRDLGGTLGFKMVRFPVKNKKEKENPGLNKCCFLWMFTIRDLKVKALKEKMSETFPQQTKMYQ